MIATIGKTYSFDAAHQLPNHDGKCARPHGHTYSVTVEVRGEIVEAHGAPDEGMVLDYFLLGEVWKKLEPDLDHRDLNESIGDECWPTTAENIAAYLFRRFAEELFLLAVGVEVVAVTVCETPKTFARVQAANG